jgi:hypothetical protein
MFLRGSRETQNRMTAPALLRPRDRNWRFPAPTTLSEIEPRTLSDDRSMEFLRERAVELMPFCEQPLRTVQLQPL